MKKETYLLFQKSKTVARTLPVSTFIGVDADSDTTTLDVNFQKEDGTATPVVIQLGFSGDVKEACKALASAMAGQNRGLITVANDLTEEYLHPFNVIDSIT
jgi:hypothetical protein